MLRERELVVLVPRDRVVGGGRGENVQVAWRTEVSLDARRGGYRAASPPSLSTSAEKTDLMLSRSAATTLVVLQSPGTVLQSPGTMSLNMITLSGLGGTLRVRGKTERAFGRRVAGRAFGERPPRGPALAN